MAGFTLSPARAILTALTFSWVIGMPPAVAETVLRIANLAEPETLDPHRVTTPFQENITRNLFEGLVVLAWISQTLFGASGRRIRERYCHSNFSLILERADADRVYAAPVRI